VTRAARRRESGITLVELLVVLVVMSILTTMIIGGWIALSNAYSFTTRSDKQRDAANQAISRMAREIRDAQSVAGGATTPFVRAYPNEIRFYSTFNMAGAPDPTTVPRLTRFILRETDATMHVGTVFREFPGPDGAWDTGDDISRPLVGNVVNLRVGEDLFTYSAVDSATGHMYQSDGTTTLVPAARVQTVRISLRVDLNPGRSPNYMDITTTVQPRNVRHL